MVVMQARIKSVEAGATDPADAVEQVRTTHARPFAAREIPYRSST